MPQQMIDRMAVHVDGDGDAVVLVHGLGGTSNVWTPLLPALARHRLVRPELPGSGRSNKAHLLERGALTLEVLVAAVLRVCSALRIERAWFAGHSLGTIVLQHLAVREPALVRGLALFGALAAPPDSARKGLRERADRARGEGMANITDAVVQATLSPSTRETQGVAVAAVRESLMGQCPDGYARTCLALAGVEAADLTQIQAPTLLVTGDDDPIAPAQGLRAMAAKIPHARVEILPRCGHWTTYERPAECAGLLKDFLSRGR
jgi:pimeloyl-ACP methyl ester carboxylesterase